jgi:aspartyl-tRNA(Asn)/glutamyl-tRNA(Gln) amidotransferase subunit A
VFTNIDLLVMPTVPLPPHQLGAWDRFHLRLRSTTPFDDAGMPAISIPCGFTKDGLPIGMQIVGPWGGDASAVQLARAYQQATDWHDCRPPTAVRS